MGTSDVAGWKSIGNAEMALIRSIAGEQWWQDVTVLMLENARKRLRALVKLIEKAKKKVMYTDFEDDGRGVGNRVARARQ